MKYTDFEVANKVCEIILTRAAEALTYQHWSADFVKTNIVDTIEEIYNYDWFNTINPYNLSIDEMLTLGFKNFGNGLFLIPLWMLHFIDGDIEVTNIFYKKIKINKEDNDHRYGCLTYGILVE